MIAATFLSACATAGPDPYTLAELQSPFICENKAQCDLFWQRAQVWIAQNSTYKIQTATDTVIQTYGPLGSRVDLAFQITRIPNADGSAQIKMSAGCANIFGCRPDKFGAILEFRGFVKSATGTSGTSTPPAYQAAGPSYSEQCVNKCVQDGGARNFCVTDCQANGG